MKTSQLSYLLFSLTVIAALILAAVPMASAHAMSSSLAPQTASLGSIGSHSAVLTSGIVVCRSLILWRHGHRITVRVCHRAHRPNPQ